MAWHVLSAAVNHCGDRWPRLSYSAAILPLRDRLEQVRWRDIYVTSVFVSGLLMSSLGFPCFRELVLTCFSSGRCSGALGPLLGGKKLCRIPLGMEETGCCRSLQNHLHTCWGVFQTCVYSKWCSAGKKVQVEKKKQTSLVSTTQLVVNFA